MEEQDYSHFIVRRALDDAGTINASFWDVLIAVTMRDSGVTRLYTENETDFRKIPWVEVLNPLRSPIRDKFAVGPRCPTRLLRSQLPRPRGGFSPLESARSQEDIRPSID